MREQNAQPESDANKPEKQSRLGRLLRRARRLLRRTGFFGAIRTLYKRLRFGKTSKLFAIPRKRRAREEAEVFPRKERISLLVPLYNTPIAFLKEMIASVQAQTYPDWELCLADGSDEAHGAVGETVRALAQADSRIVYRRLDRNGGISENTNACLDMATGGYIGLFDHDDVLHPSALYAVMRVICDRDADFIYTDETSFTGGGFVHLLTYHYKPDFAPDNLRSNNYICHFSVFSRALLARAGRFDSRFDGSQDHDMILRLTEQAQQIAHIRESLYFWRCHKASVASDIASKPYAIEAGRRAVHDHVVRVTGRECTVTSSTAYPSIYHVDYPLTGNPSVSVLIHGVKDAASLKTCLRALGSACEILVASDKDGTVTEADALGENVRVIPGGTRSRVQAINGAAREAKGDYLLLLDGTAEALCPDFLRQMLMLAQRKDVGAVGAKLCDERDTVLFAGILIGVGKDGAAACEGAGASRDDPGYMGRLAYVRDTSAVSDACMLVSRALFEQLGGFDERYARAYADIDFCLRAREAGYVHVVTPLAEVRLARAAFTRRARETADRERFRNKNRDLIAAGDPYYNPGFAPDHADFRLR